MSKKASCLYSCCLVCCASVLACGPADNANGDTPENMDPQGSGGGGGTGANPGSGGNGTGGGVPAGGSENGTGGVGDLPEVECEISATSELSPVIGTVGIVQWSTTLEGLTSAYIEFGKDTNYGTIAPVDLSKPQYETLLLGMVPSTEYHFRIVGVAASSQCSSEDLTLTTGPGPNGFSLPGEPNVMLPEQVAPGFILTSRYLAMGGGPGGGTGQVYIFNHEGEIVWWFAPSNLSDVTAARMSWDGDAIYARNANVNLQATASGGRVLRISMDGNDVEEISGMASTHHDLAPTPDGGFAAIQKEASGQGCDEIIKYTPGSGVTTIYTVRDAFANVPTQGGETCHCNSIMYHEADDSYTVSDLSHDAYFKFGSDGTLHWVIGGGGPTDFHFSGPGTSWDRQHGHHLLDETHLVFFNNGPQASNVSFAKEIVLNLEEMTVAEPILDYSSANNQSATLGDAQRLPNGNTFITFSNGGVMQEINAQGQLVQSFSWTAGGATGYAQHRASMYGKPPR